MAGAVGCGRSRLPILLIATALLAGSATPRQPATAARPAPTPVQVAAPAQHEDTVALTPPTLAAPPPVPAALTDAGLGLRAGPVSVPLQLQVPSLGVNVPVLGVGITLNNVMDAPMGAARDPVWQEAFWYRGSAVPGAASTALFAGHIDDPLGRPGVFAHIDRLLPGALIVVHDTRTGLDLRFAVIASKTYSLAQAADPAVLTEMYGAGPVAGTWPQLSADGLSHLTLITCAGTFDNRKGTHDHRLAVFAIRII